MNIPKFQTGFMRLCLAIAGCGLVGSVAHATTYTETAEAFRNPMKGFRPSRYIYDQAFSNQEYATVYKDYIPYSSLEASAGDGVQKIKDYADARWAGIETRNIKVIPRVLIVYPGTGEFWPGDIPHDGTAGQWNTDTLKNRLAAMVGKLAQAWDNDPRVAAVELGLWGKWGEHNIYPDQINGSDRIPAAFQQALGDAATSAFHNKIVMVRYPETFTGYNFGMIWDSFALPDDMAWANAMLARNTWQTRMISGEVAYDWGNQSQLGGSPDGTLGSTSNTDYVIGWIQQLHVSSLGWIAEYTQGNPTVAANAARMQKVFGYRFVVTDATVPVSVNAGGTLGLSFTVANRGSAPFYYAWPIEVSLLDDNRSVVWSTTLSTDIRTWLPGNSYAVNASFTVPTSVPNGTYTLALAILDPAGGKPSLRFANTNYYTGGRTPLARVGVGQTAANQNLGSFSGLQADQTLAYSLGTGAQIPAVPTPLAPTAGNGSVSLSWSASAGATSYTVLRSTTSGSGYAVIVNTAGTSFTDSGLTNGTTYYYVVRASNAAGTSGNSNQVSATPSGSVASATYEAEASANTLAGGAVVASSTSSSGGMKVGYLGNGGTLTFNGVNVASAGSYTLTISYLTGEARSLRVTVDGGTPVTSSLTSTGGWDTVGSFATGIALNAGANTIRLDNPGGWAPDIDKIVISGGGAVNPPAAPTGLTANAGNGSVSLAWSASSGATSYAILRSTSSGSGYTSIASTSGTSYVDATVSNGTTYYYVVTASNAGGASGNSSQASATPTGGVTTPAAPTGLAATAGNASVALSWNASSGATSYTLLRSTTSGSGYASLATISGTSYTDTGVSNGTTYYYVVRAANTAGTSGNSAPASAVPAAGGGGGGVPVTIDSFASSAQFYAGKNDLNQSIGGTCSWYLGSDPGGNVVLNSSSAGQYYQEDINRSLAGASAIRLRVRDWWASDTAEHWKVIVNDGADHASAVLSTYGTVTDGYTDLSIPIAAFGSVNLSDVISIRIVHNDSVYAALLLDTISVQ